MEKIRDFWVTLVEEYNVSRERRRQRFLDRHASQFTTSTADAEKASDASFLQNIDGSAPGKVDNASTKDIRAKSRQLKGRQKVVAWTCLFIYAILAYVAIFYALSYLEDQATVLNEKITSTISKTYTTMAETYEDLKNPGSTEEIADLMTQFYELLAELGYYEPEKIERAPHTNPSINSKYAAELGFSPKAIKMLEQLPYLNNDLNVAWSHGATDVEFLLYGTFIDLRVDENLKFIQDPLYALGWQSDEVKDFEEDGGRYMKPDYICLSVLGNHGTTMILNVKNFKLWTIDQEMGSADPALADVLAKGDDTNFNSLDNYPSRPANLALKEYMQKFRDLEWMPGGLYNDSWAGDNYARLYRENGWPSLFNRSAFQLARLQWEENEQTRWDAEQPFAEVAKYELWLDSALRRIEYKQKLISDIDAGKEIPNDQSDREKYRQELVDEVNRTMANLPELRQDLEAAQEALKSVDPTVRKAREDRIAKYGH